MATRPRKVVRYGKTNPFVGILIIYLKYNRDTLIALLLKIIILLPKTRTH